MTIRSGHRTRHSDGRARAVPGSRIANLERGTLQWIDWFHYRRFFGPLDYVPPAEYQATQYRAQVQPEAVAHRETSLH